MELVNEIPVITSMNELISHKEEIPKSNEEMSSESKRSSIGFISEVNKKGVTVRFLAGLKKLVLIKDLETTSNFSSIYKIGQVVRVAKNKLDRLCLKNKVVYYDTID